jgi:hypothetical protein
MQDRGLKVKDGAWRIEDGKSDFGSILGPQFSILDLPSSILDPLF